jgi:hypothetical protein
MENPLVVQMALARNFPEGGRGSASPDELLGEWGQRLHGTWALVEAMEHHSRIASLPWWGDTINQRDAPVVVDAATSSYELHGFDFWQRVFNFSEELPVDADNEFHDRFKELAHHWRDETAFLSAPADIILNFNYQQIIGMGPDVVPLIIQELRDRGGYWYWALRAITGADPVLPDERGNFTRMKAAWLRWHQQNK